MSFQDRDQVLSRVCIGKIVAAHGVKGLVKILPYGDDTSMLEGEVYTSDQADGTLTCTLKNGMGKYILAEVKGVTDRNAAEALRNTELFIDKANLPPIKEKHRYYHADLVGLKVIDDSGAEIGRVMGIENYGAGDLLSIKPPQGHEFLFPFTQDNVPSVDIKAGTLTALNTQEFKDL